MRRRGVVVAAVGIVTVAIAAAAVAVAAGSRQVPELPSIGADRLIASVIRSGLSPSPVSGEIDEHVDLGLPGIGDLGGFGGGGLGLLIGDHRLRVWLSADGLRVADLLPFSERSLVVGRRGAWTWDFDSLTATRLGSVPLPGGLLGLAAVVDPTEAVRRALEALAPTTAIDVEGQTVVAGRAAYRLVIRPRTPRTLVGRVEFDVDAQHFLPLGLEVFPRGRDVAALSLRFTSVRFGSIDPSTFDFSPPPGATVRRGTGGLGAGLGSLVGGIVAVASPTGPVRVVGSGWTSVLAVPLPDRSEGPELGSLLPLSGPLFSARVATAGGGRWLLVGPVTQDALAAAAEALP